MEDQFNLFDTLEWVAVYDQNFQKRNLTLENVLLQAPSLTFLAGETGPQNAAMLICLLAPLFASMLLQFDSGGHYLPVSSSQEALDRWKEWKEAGCIPKAVIAAYKDRYHDRFYLIGDNPWMQHHQACESTFYSSEKLICDRLESANKSRLCTNRRQPRIKSEEAARSLVYLLAFDDSSPKKNRNLLGAGKDKSGGTTAWLGQISPVYVQGKNLFETLLLNCCLLNSKEALWPQWQENLPYWERAEKDAGKPYAELWAQEISELPTTPFALHTLPVRRILLEFDDEGICQGYHDFKGDFLDSKEIEKGDPLYGALYEAETHSLIARHQETKGRASAPSYSLARYQAERQLWRDAASAFFEDTDLRPGVLRWVNLLSSQGLIDPNEKITLHTAGVSYDSQQKSTAVYLCEDSFSTSSAIWWNDSKNGNIPSGARLKAILKAADDLAHAAGNFYLDLEQLQGQSNEKRLSKSTSNPSGPYQKGYIALCDRIHQPMLQILAFYPAYTPDLEKFYQAEAAWYRYAQEQLKDACMDLAEEAIRSWRASSARKPKKRTAPSECRTDFGYCSWAVSKNRFLRRCSDAISPWEKKGTHGNNKNATI